MWLTTGVFTAPAGPTQSERHFLTPNFVAAWSRETLVDPFFGAIFKGAAATVGGAVDCRGRLVTGATSRPAGGTFIIRCGMLYRRGQGEADRLCVPDGGGCGRASCRNATTLRWADTLAGTRLWPSCVGSPTGRV